MHKLRILMLGLDGVTWDVLTDEVLSSQMPHLHRLRQQGTWGVLKSCMPPVTPAAWTSCTTGCHPHRHKLINFHQYSFESNTYYYTSSRTVKIPGLWHYLSDKNYRVASINVPFTYPVYPINGVLIAGLGCPGTSAEFVYPPEFKQKLLEVVPDYGVALDTSLKHNAESRVNDKTQFRHCLDVMAQRFEHRLKAAQLIQKDAPVDVMMVQFQQLDFLQHICWPFISAETRDDHPWHRDEIYKLYQKLDDIIGDLLKLIDLENGLVMTVSDHGFGPLRYALNINAQLQEWGYLKRLNIWERVVRRCRRNLLSWKGKAADPMTLDLKLPIDLSQSKAVCLFNPVNGMVHLNVKGRQAQGCVEPGREYDALVQDLKQRFQAVTNPFNGERVFEKVVTPAELWNIPATDDLCEMYGDLYLIQRKGYHLLESMKKGAAIFQEYPVEKMNGSWHYPEGVVVLAGAGMKKDTKIEADLIDVAPTLYSWLGMEVPAEVDGKPMLGAFMRAPNVMKDADCHIPASFLAETKEDVSVCKEEEAALKEQLKNLGYL